ncbi:MAG: zinc ribbon domain-containing protein [Acidobacteria bacterium]|nr:zinc ribbon domain-containing protein [Acidobacteriota bacterium]
MPIFEYRCTSCNTAFEELVLSRSDTHVECPSCGGTKVKPLVSRFAALTASPGASGFGECFNRSAGICEAGGGAMT